MHRSDLVRQVMIHLERRRHPRAVLSAIMIVAGFAGFAVSYVLLSAGIGSMAVRYGIAGIAAYLSFVGLLRAWASAHVGDYIDTGIDMADAALEGHSPSGSSDCVFGRGRSGGGGSSAGWSNDLSSSVIERPAVRAKSFAAIDVDGDDAVWLLVLVAAVASGVVAIGFVLYTAPALLAEVVVDAVIVSAVYRHMAVKDARHWATTAIRRTWLPALVVIASLVAAGYALQRLAPDARSIGPAVAALTERR